MLQRRPSFLCCPATACEQRCSVVMDDYREAIYYPIVDLAQVGENCDVFAVIPYLRGFCLSEAQVIYRPPTIVELQIAGAIPVKQLEGSHAELPTITVSVEAGPPQNNFSEVALAALNSSCYLHAPEREGVDAVAEFLQHGCCDASDQEYWNAEYWRALEEEEDDMEPQCLGGAT